MSASERIGLVLTPGASATREHSQLVAIDRAATERAHAVVERIDLGKSRKPEAHIATIRDAAERVAKRGGGIGLERVAVGGRSFGGRMCSMAVAGGMPALALVLVSYPLHPPGKPDQLRTEHLPDITVPTLFVSGTRDAFATPDELAAAAALVAGPVTTVHVDGGDHGLRGRDSEVADVVAGWLAQHQH
jgi:predicted alpha/beta-hydrolase family hydrolase